MNGVCVAPDHQGPCTAPRLPQAPAWPSIRRSRSSLQGWAAEEQMIGGGVWEKGLRRPGVTCSPEEVRPSHLLGHSDLLPIYLMSRGSPSALEKLVAL